jgi:hypothetical protein
VNQGREEGDLSREDLSEEERKVVGALERAARLEREVLAEARGSAAEDEVQRVQAALRRGSGRPLRSKRVRWLGLIAAGVALVALALWPERARRSEGGVPLGPDGLQVLEPNGAVEAFRVLRWHTTSRGSVTFDVRVLDETSGDGLFERNHVSGNELVLDERDTLTWKRVRVEIDELVNGEVERSVRVLAWKSVP